MIINTLVVIIILLDVAVFTLAYQGDFNCPKTKFQKFIKDVGSISFLFTFVAILHMVVRFVVSLV